jgi:alpha-glucosidase (family GH31 glycosyl hydrolase)
MSQLAPHLVATFEPQAATQAVVRHGNARFTLLTSRLVRMEYDPQGAFEDRASQTFGFRNQPVPEFGVEVDGNRVRITTKYLALSYEENGSGFTEKSLEVAVHETNHVWRPGQKDEHNLGGTYRTLDGRDGAVPIPPGLCSRAGWALVDDSRTLVFGEQGVLKSREGEAATRSDFYFFGYGHDYKACVRDYCAVSGQIPMIPRFVLGNWWSRYWEYSEETLKGLILDFKRHDIPLSVCVIDMDWHTEGWTGYTWNKQLFPDPKRMLGWLHEQGLRTSLNLHPADGVKAHEEAYPAFAKLMGVDPESKQRIEFDPSSPKFVDGYFRLLHHPHEEDGVDFWWMDWQQGSQCTIEGLDPLYWLNHYHYLDLGRDGKRRPLVFSRWSELGSHRYPIGFSGDTVVTWESLAFQPYFTATAANVAYPYWSHDIGGHFGGIEDDELYARWVQYGVFSPILRLHSTKNAFQDRRPWLSDGEAFHCIREAMKLRHALVPYLYSLAHGVTRDALPHIRPMYWDYPEEAVAYTVPQQYLFGDGLIVAPFVEPRDRDTRHSRQVVWLPEGDYYDFFTGEHYVGGRVTSLYGTLRDTPVFARAGACIPLADCTGWGPVESPSALSVRVFAGADGSFELYEDDGVSRAHEGGSFAVTRIEQRFSEGELRLIVSAPSGDASCVPADRTLKVEVFGVRATCTCSVSAAGLNAVAKASYDHEREMLSVDVGRIGRGAVELSIRCDTGPLLSRRERRLERAELLVRRFRLGSRDKDAVWAAAKEGLSGVPDVTALLSKSQAQALAECLFDAGGQVVSSYDGGKWLLAWNNRESDSVRLVVQSDWGSVRERGGVKKLFVCGPTKKTSSDTGLWPSEGWTAALNLGGIAAVPLSSVDSSD